ncbi:MAG: ankyrin repeat domain-containing protein [Fibromonadaceae bacterium]|nr:ankyrin repeat domain-containing protein [Fibromonadaceae bacterium]
MLHLAAEYADNVEVAEVLISMGANVNAISQGGLTPLHKAVVNVDARGGSYSPLDMAKRKGDAAMIQYLTSIGGV